LARRFLLDTNTLIALTDTEHKHHLLAQDWFNNTSNHIWGICPLTEAGFIRITTNANSYPNPRSMGQVIAILQMLRDFPLFCFWEIKESWVTLTEPFASRISGHQQVTDAYLLGLAIKEDLVLVTFDKGVRYMADAEFRRNVCLLGSSAA
jgi:toxin-antitoxin system PIN domain toxin